MPKWPVVFFPTPYIKPVVNSFGIEYVGQFYVAAQTDIPFGRAKYNFHVSVFPALFIGEVIYGVIKVYIVVVEAIHKTANVEGSAHANEVGNFVGVFKCEIGSMKSAEAAASDTDLFNVAFRPDKWHQFIGEKFVVLNMIQNPVIWGKVLRIPRFGINGVDTVNLVFAGFDQSAYGRYEPHILSLIVFS